MCRNPVALGVGFQNGFGGYLAGRCHDSVEVGFVQIRFRNGRRSCRYGAVEKKLEPADSGPVIPQTTIHPQFLQLRQKIYFYIHPDSYGKFRPVLEIDHRPAVPVARGEIHPRVNAGGILAQCAVWPKGRRPADFNAPVRSDRPVLLLSGEFDPVTPPRYGEAVLRHLPNGRHLVAGGVGHNVAVAGCAPRLLGRFVATADAKGLDATCLDRLAPPPPFVGSYGWDP